MNKNAYQLVFNAARGCIMVVAECAVRNGKGSGVTTATGAASAPNNVRGAATCLWRGAVAMGLLASALVQAQIVADPGAAANQRATVLTTPNGAPLVNIQTPSAAGVSRNTYRQFDVGAPGAVLNNSRGNAQTQLGGWVQGNPWLARGEARVILNEVNSGNPSQLRGFVEVAGQRAEVIIANPAGIQVDGAGFINASRATLTTGTPIVNGGSLEGFRVQQGTVSIGGAGLDARLTDYTAILARAIEANAAVHAQQLLLVTGDNTISADHGQVQPSQTGGSASGAPAFALDVGQLGGMYAGKISLLGTEAGVGVRNHGTLSASAGDVRIDAAGWLSSAGRIEASRGNVRIQTAQAQTHQGSVAASENVALLAGAEGQRAAIDQRGSVRAGQELQIRAAELGNAGQIAGGRLDIAAAGLVNSGSLWQSGGQALQVEAASLRNAAGGVVGSTSGGGQAADSVSTPSPGASPASSIPSTATGADAAAPARLADGRIRVDGVLRNDDKGTLASAGDLNLATSSSLSNAGDIRAQSVRATGQRFENMAGTLQAPVLDVQVDSVALTAGMVAGDKVALRSVDHTQAAGARIHARDALTVDAQRLTNAGDIRSAAGAQIRVADTLVNTGTVASSGNMDVRVGTLHSSGVLAAGLDAGGSAKPFAKDGATLTVAATDSLRSSGTTMASGALLMQGADVDLGGGQHSAHSATIEASGALRTDGAGISTAQDLRVQARSLRNRGGTLYAGGTAIAVVQEGITSTGTLAAAGALLVNAAHIDSSGTLAAGLNSDGSLQAVASNAPGLTVATSGNITATGNNLAAGAMALRGAQMDLRQSQGSAQRIEISATGGVDTRAANVVARDDLALQAQGDVDNTGGTLASQQGNLQLRARGLANAAGRVLAGGTLDATLDQAVVNNGGTLHAGASAMLSAGTVTSTGTIAAAGDLAIRAARIDSGGTLAAGLGADGSFQATASGASSLTVTAASDLRATGSNFAAGDMVLNGTAVALGQGGSSAYRADITASGAFALGSGRLLTADALRVQAHSVSNAGGTVYAGAGAVIGANQAFTSSGTVAAAGDLLITAGSVASSGTLAAGLASDGTLQRSARDGARLDIASAGVLSATGKNLAAGAMHLRGGDLDLGGSQSSAHDATLLASGLLRTDGGQLVTAGDLGVQARSVINAGGTLHAGGVAGIAATEAVVNTGSFAATGNLTIHAGSVDSSGALAAGMGADGTLQPFAQDGAALRVTATQQVRATGSNLAAGALQLRGGTVDLGGSQSSAHTIIATADGALSTRAARIVAQGDVTLQAGAEVDNTGGTVAAKGSGNLAITGTGVRNTDGVLVAANMVFIQGGAGDIHNARGQILAQGDAALATRGAVRNTGGLVQSNTTVTLDAGMVDNSQTGGSTQGIVGQDVRITAGSLDNTAGQVLAGRDLSVRATSAIVNTDGTLSAQRALALQQGGMGAATEPLARTLAIGNSGGRIVAAGAASGNTLTIAARTMGLDGTVHSGGDIALDLVGDLRTDSGHQVRAARNLQVTLQGGRFDNAGQWRAGQDLEVRADHITNAVGGELVSGGVTLLDTSQNGAGTITNRGLIDGVETRIRATTVDNVGSGRIYGDHVAIATGSLVNREEAVNGQAQAATIAARDRVDIGAQSITNREGGLVFSAGDMAVGGALDASWHAVVDGSGNAQAIGNHSATIESLGSMALAAHTLRNTNEHLQWNLVPQSQTQRADYYTPQGPVASHDVAWGTEKWGLYPQAPGKLLLTSSPYAAPQYKTYYEGPQPFVEDHTEYIGGREDGSDVHFPDVFHYGRTSPIWAALGLSQPQWDAPGPRPQPCVSDHCWGDTYAQDLALWQEKAAPWRELNTRFAAFTQGVDQQLVGYSVYRAYTETAQAVQMVESQPGVIRAGGNLQLALSGSALNQDSQILAGGAITGQVAQLTNQATSVEAPAVRSGTVYDWGIAGKDCSGFFGCDPVYGWRSNLYEESTSHQVVLPSLAFAQNTLSGGSATTIGALSGIGHLAGATTGNASGVAAMLGAQTGSTSGQVATASGGRAQGVADATAQGHASAEFPGGSSTGGQDTFVAIGRPPGTGVPSGNAGEDTRTSRNAAALGLPTGSLFQVHPESSARYLVETDARFTDYRQWLSSDYMLAALAIDPTQTQKRLGDGFYEQKLIREQVAALTGYRFLGDYRSDEQQYQALMNAGVTFASAHQLRPGIALSAAQVAQLTSDIVWLVAQDVTLRDGGRTSALVPQVYLAPRTGDLAANGVLFAGGAGGALISANDIQLSLGGDLANSGTIAGRQLVRIDAQNIANSGLIQGDVALLDARQDVRMDGGSVVAATAMAVHAGGDLRIASTMADGQGAAGRGVFASRQIDRVAGLYVSGEAGVLLASAGGNVDLIAAQIRNAGTGVTQVVAAGNVTLGTEQTGSNIDVTHNARNYARVQVAQEAGNTITGAGAVLIQAGQDVVMRAAQVSAAGALTVQATQGDITIDAGQGAYGIQTASHIKASGWLGSTTVTQRSSQHSNTAQASEVGGQRVAMASGQDVRIQGSNVLADEDLRIHAGRDLRIEAAQNTQSTSQFEEVKKSGLFDNGGIGFTIGKQQQSTDARNTATTAAASTVGTIGKDAAGNGGNVDLSAGQAYIQTGSDVLAPAGDIAIRAQTVQIQEASETTSSQTEQRFKQSGLTVAISTPITSSVQGMANMASAMGNTQSTRMQALGAANLALQGMELAGQVAQTGQALAQGNDLKDAANLSISISLGSSRSQSQSTSQSDTARGSTVTAGGAIQIQASGAGDNSDLTVRGSQVQAAGTTALRADGDIALLAAQNTYSETNSHQSSGASIGVAATFGANGVGVSATASAHKASGQGAGSGTTYTNTHVSGQTVTLVSGGDTTLQGAVVTGNTVQADVGGNLTIQSLQDTNRYDERSKNSGFSISVPLTPGAQAGGSLSAGRTRIDSDYASVGEQSAIRAGDGGFDIQVEGTTTLHGGAITSTQSAIDQDRNRFSTAGQNAEQAIQSGALTLTDIRNEASYEASGTSVGLGIGQQPGKGTSAGLSGIGIGQVDVQASSTTLAAISGMAGDTAARTGDSEAGLKPIFDKDTVRAYVAAQVVITQEFGKRASKLVGDLAESKLQEASTKQEEARQAESAGDTARAAQLRTEARQLQDDWGDQGRLRLAAHTAIGMLTGGAQGAAGAAAGTLSAPVVADALKAYGVDGNLASAITALASAAVGAVVGGSGGGAAAFNEVANNYLKHKEARRLSELKDKRFVGKCDSTCAAEIKSLEALDQQRNQQLQACAEQASASCQGLVVEVRQAAAEYIRGSSAVIFAPQTYFAERQETQALARATMDGYTVWNIGQGFVESVADGVIAMAGAASVGFKAMRGDERAKSDIRKMGDAALAFLSNPDNWPQLLGAMSPEQRLELANAYERGDGAAVAKSLGEVLSNLPVAGGAGTVKTVGKNVTKALPTARIVFNGVELHPSLPPPVAGYSYSPDWVAKAKTDNQAYSHWTGYQSEIRLANEVAGLGETVLKWGDAVGMHGNDIISVNPATGAVTLWDSKYRSNPANIGESPTFAKRVTRDAAVDEARFAILRSNLPPAVRDVAQKNLLEGNFTTNTVGAGSVKNSVQVRYCGGNPC